MLGILKEPKGKQEENMFHPHFQGPLGTGSTLLNGLLLLGHVTSTSGDRHNAGGSWDKDLQVKQHSREDRLNDTGERHRHPNICEDSLCLWVNNEVDSEVYGFMVLLS